MPLSEAQQVQAIANAAAGYGLRPDPLSNGMERWVRPRADMFEEPWLAAAQMLAQAEPGDEQQILLEMLADQPGREEMLAKVRAVMPMQRFPSLKEISGDLPPIEWLWEKWIPRGMITLLGAVPGAGKSYLALDLARRLINDEGWPDGSRMMDMAAQCIVYVDAESVPQLINQRADQWQMDKSRLYLMSPTRERMFIDFTEPEDREYLAEMVYRLDPVLIVIDSLSSISSRGENSVEDVREVLSFLNGLAQDVQSGLLLIHHLRKGGLQADDGRVGIDDFRGSGHIIAMSRSVLGLSIVQTESEFDRNGPRRLGVVKTNLGQYPKAMGVEFVSGPGDGVTLTYGDPPKPFQRPTMTDECSDWLLELLETGPMKPKEVVELAKAEGWSRSMVYRVRKSLETEIADTRGRRDPQNMWALPGMMDEDDES